MLLLLLLSSLSVQASETAKDCTCTCVVKEEDGKYGTEKASASDREATGEALKKKLGKRKCELTPVCKGNC